MTEDMDLDDVWVLCREVLENGAPLELTDSLRAQLSRTARQVGMHQQDADDSLRSLPTAMELLREIHHRIGEGSKRLDAARDRANELQQQGNFDGAQQVMRDVLAMELIPLHREQAEKTLKKLVRLSEVRATGRLHPDLPDRLQLDALLQRAQQGHVLEFTDDLLALLRRTALTAAVSESETDVALKSPEGAQAFMRMLLSRFEDARHRFLHAMSRMTHLRDSGDLEGARQQMRDVLTVEAVPRYRQAAEEQLRRLDSL